MSNISRRNASWMISNPMESEIARGTIDGMTEFSGFGERDNTTIIATGADVWRGTSVDIPWPNQLGGEQMMIVSSDYNDRLNGTGVRKVEIDYLDAIGNEQYETLNLNGTAFVRTVGTNIRFINALHAISVGSGTVASGDISMCTNGTIATVYNMISVGGNMSLSTQRMVPYNKTFYLHEWTASCIASELTVSRLRLRATVAHGTRIENVFLFNDTAYIYNTTYKKEFAVPKKIPQLSVIKVSAWVNVAGSFMAASYSGCLEENE